MPKKSNVPRIQVKATSLLKARQLLKAALTSGKYTLKEKDGAYFLLLDQEDMDFSGQDKSKRLRVSDLEKFAQTHDVPLTKRIYRKPEELPDPSLDPRAEFNRLGKRLNVRLDTKVFEEVRDAAEKADITITAWINEAIHLKLTQEK